MSSSSRGPDFGFVLTWLKRYWLAVWFGVISAMRLQVLITGRPGFDAELYLAATRAWLAGADPWITIESQRFAAPPPTLIPLAPIAILPETVGIALLIVLAVAGAVATIRLLRLPWWWILFPPFLDAAWNGNPQNLLVPLILVGAGPIAAFLKIYALVPIALTLRWRALARDRHRAHRHGAAPAVGLVPRAIRRPVERPRRAIGRRPVRDGDPLAHPDRAHRPRGRRVANARPGCPSRHSGPRRSGITRRSRSLP